MPDNHHLLLTVPDDWSNDQKGDFFEDFVGELLRPMRFQVVKRIRFTGMEIDLLARGEDQPRSILVECKAQRDPLPSDVISKLFGNVGLRKADAGWLFSTSDLGKEGRGQWEEIQADPDLASRFTWFSPQRTIQVLLSQRGALDPVALLHRLAPLDVGDWTLVLAPHGRWWLAEIVENGIPARYSVFDARTGIPVTAEDAQAVASLSPRFASLILFEVPNAPVAVAPIEAVRAPVAPVISGDSWDDLRPARPEDFVGRDDVIQEIAEFIDHVNHGITSTRTFAILGPSGWGKSSLALKLADLANQGKISKCSLTAVDTRSATNSAFVAEAVRTAFLNAARSRLISVDGEFKIESLRYPLESPDIRCAIEQLQERGCTLVLLFDQFEELFAKEELFETFTAVRELSLDLDARQVPVILGFAWKTDVSLPQQHPAYHLWHQLSDRRRTFRIREFGSRDVASIVTKAERSLGRRLMPALRGRLIEQCQGLPWLLKKLLVHVLQRVSAVESQYLLLERELDIELLFKEDLSQLGEEQIRCLKFVAMRAPVAVADVEENFSRETTNLLINSHLLVRSGMNYVIYWDIFRDYLVEGKVPSIPWARTFQRDPDSAIRALQVFQANGAMSTAMIAPRLGLKERPCINLISDLVALQLVDTDENGLYRLSEHLPGVDPGTVAAYVQRQLRRHILVRELANKWERGRPLSMQEWDSFFAEAHPRKSSFSEKTIHYYAANMRRWLVFAGLLETRGKWLIRPSSTEGGRNRGVLTSQRLQTGMFLGGSGPQQLEKLLRHLLAIGGTAARKDLEREGLRNAVRDALSLGLLAVTDKSSVRLVIAALDPVSMVAAAKESVNQHETIQIVRKLEAHGATNLQIGLALQVHLATTWQPGSAIRNAQGLMRFALWAAA